MTSCSFLLSSFTASFQTSLVRAFTKLGVTEAFDTRRVNFIIIITITIIITTIAIAIVIITRPKPPYGRQGLAGL